MPYAYPAQSVSQLAVSPVPLEQTRALRQAVLRPYLTVDDLAAHEPPGSVAFGAFEGEDLVAVGLVGPEGEPGAWRIRGMATAPRARGRGAGTAVLGALVRHASEQGATGVWCNARVRAIPLYERAGLRVVSDVFEPPDIGPHVRMELPVFQGFGPEVFEWFAGLERDNTKAYFTATRDRYEHEVRGGLEAMLDELAHRVRRRGARLPPAARPALHARQDALQDPHLRGRPRRAGRRAPASTPSSPSAACTPAPATGGSPATSSSASAPPWTTTRRARRWRRWRRRAGRRARARRGRACAPRRAAIRATTRGSSCCAASALIAGRALTGEGGIDARRRARRTSAARGAPREPLNAWLDAHVGPSTLPREPRGGRR